MSDPIASRSAVVQPRQPGASLGWLSWGALRLACALGRAGVTRDKREGDGATPVGEIPIRTVLFRADKLILPPLSFQSRPILEADGWCDDPADPMYNRPIAHPYPASAEHLWRTDDLYDIVAVLGYNDAPVVAGHGSAIFLHVANSDYAPTAGCVALAHDDLLMLLRASPAPQVLDIREA